MSLQDLRRNYLYGSLNRTLLATDPIDQFARWFDELKQAEVPDWFEINAMTLSTSSSKGEVSSRIVLLKSVDKTGFFFFTNYLSDKARQLEENPRASLTFFWPMFDRQVRVEGTVAKTTPEVSDQYFRSRPVSSRLGAWASAQSALIKDDEDLDQKVQELAKKYPNDDIPRPDFWGGFHITPTLLEFWQGKPSRLHDRFRYVLKSGSWEISRLSP